MSEAKEIKRASFDRSFGELVRKELQSGIPVKVCYKPEDIADVIYNRDVGDPGDFPYTRGIYPEMYRNRLWIKSFIVSYSTAEETNKAFKDYIASGQTGLRLLADLPTQSGLDPDHPSSWNSMMCGGVSTYALNVYEKMLKYSRKIRTPLTNLYMLGIILPTLGLALLPLASTLLQGLIQWYHVFVFF